MYSTVGHFQILPFRTKIFSLYNIDPSVYLELFQKNDCADLLSLDRNNRFTNLAVLTEAEQEITDKKYKQCGCRLT